jgi:phosphoribosylformylglycinamidine synthase
MGKYVEMDLDGGAKDRLQSQVDEMCRRLLANPIIEDFRIEIEE